MRLLDFPMRTIAFLPLVSVMAGMSTVPVYADKDTTCEAYANRSMVQIQKSEKYPGCRTQGWFAGDRWRKDWNYHFNECAQRYDINTKAHTALPKRKGRLATVS